MADPCPICLRPIASAELQPGTCHKRLGPEQWRRNECWNIGIAARDDVIAEAVATMKRQGELLERARQELESVRDKVAVALEQLPEGFRV